MTYIYHKVRNKLLLKMKWIFSPKEDDIRKDPSSVVVIVNPSAESPSSTSSKIVHKNGFCDYDDQSTFYSDFRRRKKLMKDRICCSVIRRPHVFITIPILAICLLILSAKISGFYISALYISIAPSYALSNNCSNICRFELVETIPENLTYNDGSAVHTSTFDAWSSILDDAKNKLDLGVFYWSLTSEDVEPGSNFPSASRGQQILDKLLNLGSGSNVRIRVAQNAATNMTPQTDSAMLQNSSAAQVTNVNVAGLMGGVLHTKLWVVDDDAFYLGSANMDFRSLTQVKELGVLVRGCSCLARDVDKIFQQYWEVGVTGQVPPIWPPQYTTTINRATPALVLLNGIPSYVYFSSSPPLLASQGRTDDGDAIVSIIDDARLTVDIAVMDYFPRTLYTSQKRFWPLFDDSLRRAALERGVRVRLMASHWKYSRPDLPVWLKSLQDLSADVNIDIQTKLFVVPTYTDEQRAIPFGRVNHNKYMVTDRVAYIGTSNWSGDYFMNTGGVGFVVNETTVAAGTNDTLRQQLQAVFERDWNSKYARPIEEFLPR